MSVLVAEFCMCRDSVARDWAAKSCKIIIKGQEREGQQGQERERKEQINGQTDKGSSSEGCPVKTPSWPFCTQKRVLPRHVVRKLVEKGHARTSAAQPIQSAP
ncbi:hypothetical protein H0G86_011287 [Trichoderma simmonsii]|uniref:Uncharacterized protein n=1 Tax=Trichoderma simmonsii TaxID=1491479 RepID=A0A8G0LLA1_9HYPO|nr:hypothetical protein H0G86_011287 [Trichoderma simmonsii]